jgi:uncharacterized membrane protein YccF (DUF307 family)
MSLLGNLLWIVLGGLFASIGYFASGIALCCTIIGIPFGLASFKLGFAVLAPFGKELVESPQANSPLRLVMNLVWLLLFGWEIALGHLVLAVLLGITIIGLPFAKQHLKLVPLALFPFGRELR